MVDEQNPLEEVTGRRVKKTLVTCHSDIQKEILKEEYESPVVNKNSHNHTPKDSRTMGPDMLGSLNKAAFARQISDFYTREEERSGH
ncbi:hypothetical protein JOM56_014873 [Amanita muscaria]